MSELKPCPFCGVSPRLEKMGKFDIAYHEQEGCLLSEKGALLAEKWNKRHFPEGCTPADAKHLRAANWEMAEEIDVYRKALEDIAGLPIVRQDECCNIALNALDKFG